jgi:hypothetical protein
MCSTAIGVPKTTEFWRNFICGQLNDKVKITAHNVISLFFFLFFILTSSFIRFFIGLDDSYDRFEWKMNNSLILLFHFFFAIFK